MNAPARLQSILLAFSIICFACASASNASLVHSFQNRYVKSEIFVAPPESGTIEENEEIVSFDYNPFAELADVIMSNEGGSGSANSDQSSLLDTDLISATGNADASLFAEAFVTDEYGFGETHFEVMFEVLVAGDYQFDAFATSAGSNFFDADSYVELKDLNGPLSISVLENDPAVSTLLSLPAGEYAIIAHSRVDVTSNFDPETQSSSANASFGVTLQLVPEPGTLALLIIGLGAMARRRIS